MNSESQKGQRPNELAAIEEHLLEVIETLVAK